MPAIIFWIAVIAVVFYLEHLKKDGIHSDKCREALDDLYDLRSWIIEHANDCSMSEAKWRELLPICRFADERFKELRDNNLRVTDSCEALLLRILGDEEEPETTPM